MKTFKCSVAQKGFFAGPVFYIGTVKTEERMTADPKQETERLRAAVTALEKSVEENSASGKNAAIGETVLQLLTDETFTGRIEKNIAKHNDAVTAVRKAAEELSDELGKVASEYIRCRQEDIRGIAEELSAIMTGTGNGPEECSALCTAEISPAQLSSIEESRIGGLLTEKGSPNSHASILAGNMGVPYLYANGEAVKEAEKATYIILDSETGTAVIDPDPEIRMTAECRMKEIRKKRQEAELAENTVNSVTCRTKVYANIEGPQDIGALLDSSADGIGLFRTEFLFLGRDTVPTEEEQYEAYKAVLEAMGEKEVIIRTMDIGSDKKVSWLEIPHESNPALGMRGARVSLENKDLFCTQLRALLRAGTLGNLKIMFPMIASAWEIDEIRDLIRETAEELKKKGIEFKIPELGIMVETPAAALCAEELAEKVSFFSIGTNDLTQYTLALDREAQGLDRYFKPHHEAVFKLIRMTAEGGHKHNVPTGVCGQLAADPEAIGRLIGTGVDELSVAVRKVKATKRLVSEAEKTQNKRPVSDVSAVADGELIPMKEIPDPVFAGGTMGECFGILPANGNVYAPVSGIIRNIAETGHAITIAADDGRNLLVHVGIDTVKLGGKAFKLLVRTGEHVEADQLMMEADLDTIRNAGLSTIIIVAALDSI